MPLLLAGLCCLQQLAWADAAAPEKPHKSIPEHPFLFVANVALLLLRGIQNHIGEDAINSNKVSRLKNFNEFRKDGMLKRIFNDVVELSGHFFEHYTLEEWVNSHVVKKVMVRELDYLCDDHRLHLHYLYLCALDRYTRQGIVESVMRDWRAFRDDAMEQIQKQIKRQQSLPCDEVPWYQ